MYRSLDESIPLGKVLSPLSSTLVEERLLSEIAQEIGSSWREIARRVSKDDLIAEIRERFPDPDDAPVAALEFLNGWFESRGRTVMTCELYDILRDVDLASLAGKKFSSRMMPDAASGLLEKPLILRSDRLTSDVIRVVADIGRAKWRDIARHLKFAESELPEYERSGKLDRVLHDWTDRAWNASVEVLLKVCDIVKIGGRVRSDLKTVSASKPQSDLGVSKEHKKGRNDCILLLSVN